MKTPAKIAIIAVSLFAVAGGAFAWHEHQVAQSVPDGIIYGNGRLEFTRVDVAVKYPGRITQLLAQEGDNVTSGQILAQEDKAAVQAQYDQASAQQNRAVSATGRASAELVARQAALQLARDELRHAQKMRQQNLVSDMEVTQRRTQVETAQAAVNAASQAVQEAVHAKEGTAAQVNQVQTVLDDMTIRAPVSGRIEYRVIETGSVLPPGGRVYSMLDPVDPYMTLFFPTASISNLKIGDEARIRFDGMDTPVAATVSFIDSQAQFTPKYVETATEREQLVYRVKLRVTADEQKRLGTLLKAGMTGEGYIKQRPDAAWPKAALSGDAR
ncbi:HlyD family secretion protein [Acetobacter pasteurianus]|uniref:HlyD family secretion protein n=1 Tax=Acetobacter pasteurianus TaxID=438 RepID=UPI003D1182E9